MTIRLRRHQARRAAIGGLICLTALLASLGAYGLGRLVSPLDRTGHPLLLTPDRVWTLDYQTQARTWVSGLHDLDVRLHTLLVGQATDLYSLANAANDAQNDAQTLAEAITLSVPPPALKALQELAQTTASAYLDSTARITAWIAQPNTALQADAARSLLSAETYLNALEASPWLTNR